MGGLDLVFQEATKQVGVFVKIGQGLGALFTVITIYNKVWGKFAGLDMVSIWEDVSKPIIFLILIGGYPYFFTGIYELSNTIGDVIGGKGFNDNMKQIIANSKAVNEASESAMNFKQDKELESVLTDINNGTKSISITGADNEETNMNILGILDVGTDIKNALLGFIHYLLMTAASIVVYIVLVIRIIYLSILYMIGPIAFGISCFSAFEGSWKTFAQQFINVAMWFPVTQMLLRIMVSVTSVVGKDFEGAMLDLEAETVSLIMNIIIVIAFLFVPKISGFVVGNPQTGMVGATAKIARALKGMPS